MQVSTSIRRAFYSALNGNIQYNSNDVPVYDAFAIPEQPSYPYILLSTQNNVQRGIKRCKAYNSNILIDIVTGSAEPIGREQAEDIAWQIEQIVIPETFADLPSAYWKINDTTRAGDTDTTSKNGVYYIYRKLLTYNLLISK